MDYVIELTYPVGESISEGIIMTGNQLFGVVGTLICDFFMEYVKEIRYLPHLFFICLLLISFICVLLIKEELNRHIKDTTPSENDPEEEQHNEEDKVEENKIESQKEEEEENKKKPNINENKEEEEQKEE